MLESKQFVPMEVKAVEGENPSGEFEAVLSAPTMDRDGEVIVSGAFEPLPPSIPIHVDHDASYKSLVGSARPYYDGPILKARGVFSSSPLGQQVRNDVLNGHMRTMSVGFMAAERATVAGVPTIKRGELLEASFVTIPANRQAVVLGAKDGADADYGRAQRDVDLFLATFDVEDA